MKNESTKGKILIIEDSANFRRIYHSVLEGDGYEVIEAEDGESGLRLALSEEPNLILLDLVLPKLHGLEVLKIIRADKKSKDIPIIIFSVLGTKENIQKGLELGANDYTIKGAYSPKEILSKIRVLLAQKSIQQNIQSYKIEVKEGRKDAAKLQQDIGLTKLFDCPHCHAEMSLELIPDFTRTDGHWFHSHFTCQKCGRGF